MIKHTPIWKIVATSAGAGLTGVATYMNADAIAAGEGWLSPLTIGTIILTISGALALPLAERALHVGQWLKAAFLVLFFVLVLIGSLMNTLARTASYRDATVATGIAINARAELAREAYTAAQRTVADECKKRGPLCRAAEAAVVEARLHLASAAPPKVADPAAQRLAAILGISESAIALYVPLILPTALELGGFLLLALGLAPPVRSTTKVVEQIKAVALATKPKSGTRAYWLARLQREKPELAARVAAGELSVYAASIQAGLRKAPTKRKWDANDYVRVTA
jgi:hypothetical protein